MTVRLGIEVLIQEQLHLLSGARVGAVVHPASIQRNYAHTADVLFDHDSVDLVALFGPQHGARGEKQDNMIESEFYRDPDTALPVHSLYGETRRPTEEMMREIDVLIYDLQDVGTRVYTFIHTMAYCMQACAEFKKRMIVLDRPNPINGRTVEGNLLHPEFSSFVGLYPIPMRHGMTVGELAGLLNVEFGIDCDLTVVTMQGWNRSHWFNETGLPWVQPSPNLPTLDSATVYPGTVLVEGTLLSEGRGTTRPFEYVGAPYIRAREYADHLNELNLPGAWFRPVHFQPAFQKWVGSVCGGVQIHILDRDVFKPYATGIALIWTARRLYPQSFAWRQPPYEYEYSKLPIDILCGGSEVRGQIENGVPLGQISAGWRDDEARFLAQRKPYLLYD